MKINCQRKTIPVIEKTINIRYPGHKEKAVNKFLKYCDKIGEELSEVDGQVHLTIDFIYPVCRHDEMTSYADYLDVRVDEYLHSKDHNYRFKYESNLHPIDGDGCEIPIG